jgi:hypothetical protein
MVTANPLCAYSVLSHEATIDVTWDSAIAPLLKQRFPRASADDLLRARSFAYGGSVIQDLGYYPFGNRWTKAQPALQELRDQSSRRASSSVE